MPIDPTLQTPIGYATPQQLAAMREYSRQLLEQSGEAAKTPTQGIANVTKALIGGLTSGYADTKEQKARAQAAQLLGQQSSQGDISGMIGSLSNPYVNPEAVKLGVAMHTPTRVQMGSGTVLMRPTGEIVPNSFLPETKVVTEEANGVKTQRVLRGDAGGGFSDVPIQEAGNGPRSVSSSPLSSPSLGPAPSSDTVNPRMVGGQPQNLTGPTIAPTPVRTVQAQPLSPASMGRIDQLAAKGAEYEGAKEAGKTYAVETAKANVKQGDLIEKRAADARDEIPQLELLKKAISNPQFYSGIFAGEAGSLDQIGKMFGLSTGQTASLQQFAQKLGSAGSLEQIREMGEQGAVRIPEMHMIEKSNFDIHNTPEANVAAVELRQRAAKRSMEMGDMKRKYEMTGNIYGRPGQGSGHIDSGFRQQVSDFYTNKPLISDSEMARYEALASNQKTKQGIGAPIAGGPMKIADKAGYDALPKGQQYIAPDGSLRTKQ